MRGPRPLVLALLLSVPLWALIAAGVRVVAW